jgi:hypothetical protein
MHLVLLIGPAAAGKMTVGAEVARLAGYKLFHNHLTIEPFLEVFEWGSPSFDRLRADVRRRVIEEAVLSDLPGLIFSFVWALDDEGDRRVVDEIIAPAVAAGARIDVVELIAAQAVRLAREGRPDRLERKRSKRDVERSRGRLVDADERHRFNSRPGEHLGPGGHWRFDNSGDDPAATAREVVTALGIATSR